MRLTREIEVNIYMEKILKCYINGKSSCEECNLSEECKKFKKYMKTNAKYTMTPITHTSGILRGD